MSEEVSGALPSLISLTVSVDVKHYVLLLLLLPSYCEPVWPSGKVLGWSAEGPWFDPLRLSFLFSSKKLWFMDTVL